ncbi:MAG: hypothetical protein ACYSUQ_04610 [Planctomycetota bacterium]|jgi:hypothetical protein
MSAAQVNDRYCPSGRIDGPAFAIWVAIALLAGAGLAVALFLLFRAEFYFVGLIPALLAICLSGVVFLAVSRGRCRNRSLAALLGLVAGTLMYLGYYHIDMVAWFGLQNAHRVDLLPGYIHWRVNTDVVGDPALPGPEDDGEYQPPDPVKVAFNWVFFALELGLCAILPALAGWLRAERPYCEQCNGWMNQSLAHFERAAAPTIVGTLEAGRLGEVLDFQRIAPRARKPATILAVAHCAAEPPPGAPPCPVYLSIKPVKNPSAPPLNPFQTMRRALVRDRALRPAETTALVPLFPALRRDANQTAAEEIDVITEQGSEAAGQVRRRELQGVRILEEAIPAPLCGNVLATASVVKSNLLACVPIVSLLPVSIPLILGVVLVMPLLDSEADDHFPGVPAAIRWSVLVAGGVGLVLAAIWVFRHNTCMRDRYVLRRTRHAVERRPEVWVAPDDPEAYFVEIVPRENWAKLKAETATDFGFLKCDAERAALYFEGDSRRICIPLETLTHFEAEPITDASGMVSHCAVVVEASDEERTLELPFIPYFPPWTSGRKASQRRAATLLLRVQECIGTSRAAPLEDLHGA